MKTTSNNNNIESKNQEFFTKGKKYRCIKSVNGNKSGRETFTKGQIYEQYTEPSVFYGWLRNNQGERHAWPQIDEMADYLETWPETKPEDIDPRLYFEPVEDVKEAEEIKVGDKVRHNLTGNRVATVTGIRRVQGYKWQGEITVYRLDFGESVKGPCGMEMNGGEYQREAFTLQNSGEITDENEAARALAGKEAHFIISDKDGRETLNHSFTFKDSFRNQANRIWIDVKEKGDVIGRWLMLKYDVIKELANTGRVVVSHPDGERHCITLA